jgi:hypothetical protein
MMAVPSLGENASILSIRFHSAWMPNDKNVESLCFLMNCFYNLFYIKCTVSIRFKHFLRSSFSFQSILWYYKYLTRQSGISIAHYLKQAIAQKQGIRFLSVWFL